MDYIFLNQLAHQVGGLVEILLYYYRLISLASDRRSQFVTFSAIIRLIYYMVSS